LDFAPVHLAAVYVFVCTRAEKKAKKASALQGLSSRMNKDER
jgi:hypothetical protein